MHFVRLSIHPEHCDTHELPRLPKVLEAPSSAVEKGVASMKDSTQFPDLEKVSVYDLYKWAHDQSVTYACDSDGDFESEYHEGAFDAYEAMILKIWKLYREAK